MINHRVSQAVTGIPVSPFDLTIVCKVCHKLNPKIEAILEPLALDKDYPNRRVFRILGVDPDSLCPCLLEHFRQIPFIVLYDSEVLNN